MIKNKWSFLFLLGIAVLLASCHAKGPKEARFIPKDASFVVAFDPASLQDKMKNGNIDIDSLFRQAIGNDSLRIKDKKAFENFKNAGVDWSEKFFIFMTEKTDATKGQSRFINLLGNLKDSAKLLAYLQSIDAIKGRDVKQGKGYAYIQLDYHGMISWTDKNVLATFYTYTEGSGRWMDSSQSPAAINKSAEIEKEVARYFALQQKESIASVAPFVDMFKEKADGYFLNSTNSALTMLSRMPMQLPKLDELLKDNYTTGTFNFGNGKITAVSRFYPNNQLGALLNKYSGPTVHTSLIEHYPSSNVDLMAMVSFNPDFFGGLLQQLEVETLADGFLEKAGLSSKDLYKCLKGDIAFVASDFNFGKNTSGSFPPTRPTYKMILNAAIGDTASFEKLMGKAVESGFVIRQANGYRSGILMSSLGLFLHTDNKNLILASDSLTYAAYVSKSEKLQLSSDVMQQISGKSAVAYIDVNRILNSFPADSATGPALVTAKATFKDIIATSDNFDGTKLTSRLDVRFQDEKQNSLVTLMKLIPSVADQIKKAKPSVTGGDAEGILSLPFLSKINNL